MTHRALLAALLSLLACGGSEGSSDDEELANASRLTRVRAEQQGVYCCYVNGTLQADAPEGCQNPTSCFFSETYSDLSPGGRGTMCGYLLCE